MPKTSATRTKKPRSKFSKRLTPAQSLARDERRAEAKEDERVRFTLQLKYAGFYYPANNRDPLNLYTNPEGKYFVRITLGRYKRLPAKPAQTIPW